MMLWLRFEVGLIVRVCVLPIVGASIRSFRKRSDPLRFLRVLTYVIYTWIPPRGGCRYSAK